MLDNFLETKRFLYDKLKNQYGNCVLEDILNGYKEKRFTTFRINTQKEKSLEDIKEILQINNLNFTILIGIKMPLLSLVIIKKIL